ncbi:hypothetical protein V6Z11_A09G075400 [Gossypium hirsutum]
MTFCSVFIKNAAKISLHNISLHGSLIAAAIYLGWIIFTGCCEYHEDDESDEEFSPKKIGGIAISMVMKYADNIVKVYSTSVAMLLTAVVSVFLFGFNLTLAFFLGAT